MRGLDRVGRMWGSVEAVARCAVAAVCFVAVVASAEETMEIYPLGGRDAGEVAAALEPLLSEGARVSRLQGELLVVGSEADHAIVRKVVSRVEAGPEQYRIQIVQGASRAQAQSLLRGEAGGSVTSTRSSSRGGMQRSSLRVTAGEPARLESGTIVQAVDSVYLGYGGGLGRFDGGVGVSREDREHTRGFSVLAQPRGNAVELRISPFSTTAGRDASEESVESMVSVLTVETGKWVSLSGDAETGEPSSRSYGTRPRTGEASQVLVRVDLVDPSGAEVR